MKLDEGDRLVGVQTCEDTDHVLLATAKAKSIRFEATDVRVFAGRNSTGVRGIRLADGDEVISMSILSHAEFSVAEREAYLKRSRAERADPDDTNSASVSSDEPAADGDVEDVMLTEERYAELAAQEQFILTVTANGFGKRTSAYEYRITNRGGQGVVNIVLADVENNGVVASFPVVEDTGLVMMTDGGQLIRTGVDEVRIAGRSTRGVTLFRVGDDERVVTVTHLSDDDDDEETDEVGEGTQTGDAPADNAEDSVTTEAELPQGEDAEAAPEKSDGEE